MRKMKLFAVAALVLSMAVNMFGEGFEVSAKRPHAKMDTVYEVHTERDLLNISDSILDGNDYTGCEIRLMEDLDFNGIGFTPLGNKNTYFNGYFNGNGYKISNLKVNCENLDYVGFIRFLDVDGCVSDLTIYDTWFGPKAEIVGRNYVGSIVGYNAGKVIKCRNASCSVKATGSTAGGIVGYNARLGEVTNCRISTSTDVTVFCNNITGHKTVVNQRTTDDGRYTFVDSETKPIYGKSGNRFVGVNLGIVSRCESYLFFAW